MLEELRAQIRRIRKGEVMTYGEVAKAAGYPGAARQVAWALQRSTPDIPWHRVVGAGLRIRLPAEGGLEQALRLQREGWTVNGNRLVKSTTKKLNK